MKTNLIKENRRWYAGLVAIHYYQLTGLESDCQVKNPVTVTTVLTTGKNKYKPTVNNCSTNEVNILLKDCADLISPTYKDWYARTFYKFPPLIIQSLASQARADGKNPPRLFSYLLKRANKKVLVFART